MAVTDVTLGELGGNAEWQGCMRVLPLYPSALLIRPYVETNNDRLYERVSMGGGPGVAAPFPKLTGFGKLSSQHPRKGRKKRYRAVLRCNSDTV